MFNLKGGLIVLRTEKTVFKKFDAKKLLGIIFLRTNETFTCTWKIIS
jgi:hypothetical protein